MTMTSNFVQAAKEHHFRNPGILEAVCRVVGYTGGLAVILTSFIGLPITICVFILFSLVFELILSCPKDPKRLVFYLLCLCGIGVMGAVLIHQGHAEQVRMELKHADLHRPSK